MGKLDSKMYAVLCVSRNKDNKHIEEFKERKKPFLVRGTEEEIEEVMQRRFDEFMLGAMAGETCRMYRSINPRKHAEVKKQLLCKMIQEDNLDLVGFERKIVSVALQSGAREGNKWLFDYDDVEENLGDFLEDLRAEGYEGAVEVTPTVTGYAVVVENGFDTRNLLTKWEEVTLKRDGLRLEKWETKERN